jgi:hypothetical protein
MSRKITIPKNSQTEFKIENYLEDHVDLIEDGLQLIRRQYKLYYKSRSSLGDVDLFCQGEDGAQVIVELKSGELQPTIFGQVMAYYAICKLRSDLYGLPEPRVYCIGASVSPQYILCLELLDKGKTINLSTKTYKILPGTLLSDKVFPVELFNYNIEDAGIITLRL